MSAHNVSPPSGGDSTMRRIEPIDGSGRHVTSLCQTSGARSFPSDGKHEDLGLLLRRRRERVHLEVSEPPAERDVRSRSRSCWSRKKITFHSSSAARIAAIVSSGNGRREVDATDLGADGRSQRLDLHARHEPWQRPILSVWNVPSAHGRSGFSCENTPFGLSQPGTTHACTIQPVTPCRSRAPARTARRSRGVGREEDGAALSEAHTAVPVPMVVRAREARGRRRSPCE